MVFQHFGLMPWRSVLSNVEFPLELDGVKVAERRERAEELLQLVGLTGYRKHLPHEISGGMQQRVSIARALMRQPSMLFMDEPFGALDAQTRERLQEDFLKIWAKFGTTVLFVTHSIDEALVLSDRVFVFSPSPGRIRHIVDSPLAKERLGGDPRGHAEYGRCRALLREMLNGGEA
jgi:NitT/TauT family transport system ATP-binding protein